LDIIKKVHELSQYLDNDAIASALKIPEETVVDILEGKANVEQIQTQENDSAPVIHVNSVKTAYRQKIISVMRAKGGVGCSVISLGLSYHLSKEIKVLLIDLNLTNGGGDLSFYLNLPDYPHLGVYKDNLLNCVIPVELNFDVLQAPNMTDNEKQKVSQIINHARQDYDAIVIDLPNRDDDLVMTALECSNTLVAVTSDTALEIVRLATILSQYQQKNIIVTANACNLSGDAKEYFTNYETVKIEHDNSLSKILDRCDLPGEKTIFMRGIKQVGDLLFERKQKGILKSIFGGS